MHQYTYVPACRGRKTTHIQRSPSHHQLRDLMKRQLPQELHPSQEPTRSVSSPHTPYQRALRDQLETRPDQDTA